LSIQLLFSLAFFLLIPGLPMAVFIGQRLSRPHLCLALAPFLSISANFVLLYSLNFIGIRPSFSFYALVLGVGSLVVLVRNSQEVLLALKANLFPMAAVLPAAAISFYLWATSFSEYNFVAANQDSFNHNLWIARIAQVHSVMASDSFVGSPLQGLGTGTGFYPFSWHSAVAVAHSVGAVPIPILSLATTIILWAVALPLGLAALATEIAPRMKFLGLVAGVLVQLFPLVPGVPMSWGSMTSTIGISFLPIGFLLVMIAFERRDVFASLLAMFAFVSLIFIHTPAAATLGVLTVSAFPAYLRRFNTRLLVKFALAALASMIPILILFRSYIFDDRDDIKMLWGAVFPFWDSAIGAFVTSSVNVPNAPVILSLLFFLGIGFVAYLRITPALLLGTFGIFVIYLISGAPSGVLNDLRIITTPWYASYERTAWVAVPFIALIAAFPICALFESTSKTDRLQKTVGIAVALLLVAGVVRQQVDATTTQLSKGPLLSEVIGKRDRPLLQRLKSTLKDDEIVYSFANDGSTYAFMYEGILVTAGKTYNRDGENSVLLEALNNNIGSICESSQAQEAIKSEKIAAFIFGGRLLGWGPPGWQKKDIEALGGLRLVDSGQYLYVAVPDLSNCVNVAEPDPGL
jgi:IS1 family transposase